MNVGEVATEPKGTGGRPGGTPLPPTTPAPALPQPPPSPGEKSSASTLETMVERSDKLL